MKRYKLIGLLVLLLLFSSACNLAANPTQSSSDTESGSNSESNTEADTVSANPEPTWPQVVGEDPSYRVAAFYYPWYQNREFDSKTEHWGAGGSTIASDYYPALGTYSSSDPAVLAQHFAWLRQAKVGVIIVSWHGQLSQTDRTISQILDVADHYKIKVAFQIEPYAGRTAIGMVDDVEYIYTRYGDHPAFFRTTSSSRWSPDSRPKGLFFVWSAGYKENEGDEPRGPVGASYWKSAVDAIHDMPDGGLVIANAGNGSWIDEGHFDGLYNYVTLHITSTSNFSWAKSMPPGALYFPSVIPGNSAKRIGYPENTYVPRNGGETYDEQWTAALNVGVEPEMVTITSFNEWHEGTMIEPIADDPPEGYWGTYEDFGDLPPDAYLDFTAKWVDQFLAMEWPETQLIRIKISSTSNWLNFYLVYGAAWARPDIVSTGEGVTKAQMEGGLFVLQQTLERAQGGGVMEVVFDILFSNWRSGESVKFKMEGGNIGLTEVTFYKFVDGEPVEVDTFSRIKFVGPNQVPFEIPVEELFGAAP